MRFFQITVVAIVLALLFTSSCEAVSRRTRTLRREDPPKPVPSGETPATDPAAQAQTPDPQAQAPAPPAQAETPAQTQTEAPTQAPVQAPVQGESPLQAPTQGKTSVTDDPLTLGTMPPGTNLGLSTSSLPPYDILRSEAVVPPMLKTTAQDGLVLDLDKRVKAVEDLMNRMTWTMNRETAWAKNVHEIIQNYQYKYTKVLDSIKKHSDTNGKMRDLLSKLKKARLHELLEQRLAQATLELKELASSSSETSEDEGSYAALAERVKLMEADLEKMDQEKINKVSQEAQEDLKKLAEESIPPDSSDAIRGILSESGSEGA